MMSNANLAAAAAEDDADTGDADNTHIRFAIAVAATGNSPDISNRLFKAQLVEAVWEQLRDRPTGLPAPFRRPPDPVSWSQEALTWRHEVHGPLDAITVVNLAPEP